MKLKYSILKEEFPAKETQISNFQQSRGIQLPEDYQNFLLEYNGGIPTPNYLQSPKLVLQIEKIERFYSLQDIEYEVYDNQVDIHPYIKEDVAEYFPDLQAEHFIPIGLCYAGKNLNLYCGPKGNGEIYYSDYSGGMGLEKTGLYSFSELLESLADLDHEDYEPDYKIESDKIFTFDHSYYWEEENKERSLKRFQEVLAYYGHPNRISKIKHKDVVAYYLDFPVILNYFIRTNAQLPTNINDIENLESLQVLIANGSSINGVLNATRNIEIIQYLIEKCGQDINSPYDGTYPLLNYAKIEGDYSSWERNTQYELLRDIINLGYKIDFEIKDENGQSLKEKFKILEDFHKEYEEKYSSR